MSLAYQVFSVLGPVRARCQRPVARRVPVGALTQWRAFGAQVQAPCGASRRHCGAQSRTSVGAPALQGSTDRARESFAACVGVQHRLVRLLLTRRRPVRGMGEHRRVLRALPGRGSAEAPYGAHPSHRVAISFKRRLLGHLGGWPLAASPRASAASFEQLCCVGADVALISGL